MHLNLNLLGTFYIIYKNNSFYYYIFFIIVSLDEKNEQFYNQIYTGQKISFGKTQKDYQG